MLDIKTIENVKEASKAIEILERRIEAKEKIMDLFKAGKEIKVEIGNSCIRSRPYENQKYEKLKAFYIETLDSNIMASKEKVRALGVQL